MLSFVRQWFIFFFMNYHTASHCVLHFFNYTYAVPPHNSFSSFNPPSSPFYPFRVHNLSLIVFADWHDEIILQREKYVDDNTHSTWYPVVGGSNVPAINNLLVHFQAQLGLQTFDGQFGIGGNNVRTHNIYPSILHYTTLDITLHYTLLFSAFLSS